MKRPTPMAPPSEIISIWPAVIDRRNSGADFFISNQIPFSFHLSVSKYIINFL